MTGILLKHSILIIRIMIRLLSKDSQSTGKDRRHIRKNKSGFGLSMSSYIPGLRGCTIDAGYTAKVHIYQRAE